MVNKIKMEVDNFALIDKADFEIEDITIIKGMEGHGRSDINKVLFSVLITWSAEGLFAANNMVRSYIYNAFESIPGRSFKLESDFNDFMDNGWEEYNVSREYLDSKYDEFKKLLKKYKVSCDTSNLEEALNTFDEYGLFRSPIFQHMLDLEFKNYSLAKYEDYEIKIFIDDCVNFIKNENDQTNIGLSYETPNLEGNVLYLGPRPIFDFEATNNIPYHYEELFSNMTETYIECRKDTGEINELIKDFIGGSFSYNSSFAFHDKQENDIGMSVISREIKQLGVILFLLENRGIPEKSIMILDRIDKDMSDLYQNKLVKILFKLKSELDLTLLIYTDSDSFSNKINDFQDEIPVKVYQAVKNNSKNKYTFKIK